MEAITPWTLTINTNNVILITNAPYDAVNDGVTDNALAISNAIVAAARGGTTNGLSGGTVEIPAPGVFLCGPLNLANNVNLQVDAGALLRMLPYGSYPGGSTNPPNFISGSHLTNIEISGSGAIDGQGAPWWPGYKTNSRPIMIYLDDCKGELIQNLTLSNSPMFHISISGGSAANTTVQGVTVRAPDSATGNPPSHNTDACDVAGTNVFIRNCNISTGDDDFACGGGTHDVLLTNNTYGNGHGISIGSYTDDGGVSNLTVINCTMNGTENGIRIKSDNDRGGLVQNISYLDISMTNVDFPIQAYAYYNEVGTPINITPATAAGETVAAVNSTTPTYRNIMFSNITATAVSGYPAVLLWPRTEAPGTNFIFDRVNISASQPAEIYNARGVQFVDTTFALPPGISTFELFNAQVTISNSAPAGTLFTFDGLTTNGYGNSLEIYNAPGSLSNTNALGAGSLTLAASTFTVSNDLTLFPATVLDYLLGTNPATLVVTGSLTVGGTINIGAGGGFADGTYTLLTCGRTLSGNPPLLGARPTGYAYSLNTNSAGQVALVVTLVAPTNLVAQATNLQINLRWNSVPGASSYNLKRGTTYNGPYPTLSSGLTATNFADANVTNAVEYFYVVTAVGAGGESTNSLQVSATPLPSNLPPDLVAQEAGGQMTLSWPPDHLGWRLQIQTNGVDGGLSTNWATVPNSTNFNSTALPIVTSNGSVFLRLVYP